jgi:NAD-dependent SIR2 family protein deacetylase
MPACPYCGKEHQHEALQCSQCGTAFREDPADLDPRQVAGQKLMNRGVVWFGFGLAISFLSYAEAARHGGTYVIAIGTIIFGLAQFFRGRRAVQGRFEAKEEGEELLELAARLESVDRTKAIGLYHQIINAFPGTPQSEEAARSIHTLETRERPNKEPQA